MVWQLDAANTIRELVEKPKTHVSDLAVIGIYYFKAIEELKQELQHDRPTNYARRRISNQRGIKGMMAKGKRFVPGEVKEWMDCGNKDIIIATNAKMLRFLAAEGKALVHASAVFENTTVIPPCYIGKTLC